LKISRNIHKGCWTRFKKKKKEQIKNYMDVIDVNDLIGENYISYSKINESEKKS
jgi:hypothetical protein